MQNKLQKEMDDRMTNPSEIPTESSEKKREPLKRHLGHHRNLIFVPHWYHVMLIGILCLCLGVVAYSKTTEFHKESTQTTENNTVQKPVVTIKEVTPGEVSNILLNISNPSSVPVQVQKTSSEVKTLSGRQDVVNFSCNGQGVKEFEVAPNSNLDVYVNVDGSVRSGDLLRLRTDINQQAGLLEVRLK